MEKTSEKQGIWSKFGSIINSSIVIVALTVLVYVIPYNYQKGYKSYFLIPGEFIELSLPQLFHPNLMVLMVGALFVLVFLGFVFIAMLLLLPLDNLVKKMFKKSFIGRGEPKYMKAAGLVSLFIAIGLSMYSAHQLGYLEAQNQNAYWVVEENGRQYAVVDTYKEYMILMPYEGATYLREWRLVKPEALKNSFKLMVVSDSLRDGGR